MKWDFSLLWKIRQKFVAMNICRILKMTFFFKEILQICVRNYGIRFHLNQCELDLFSIFDKYRDVTILLFRSCYIQEVLAALIILSSNSWPVRLSFLFDLFAEIDANQLAYDDAMLVTQVKIVEIEYSVINICYCR